MVALSKLVVELGLNDKLSSGLSKSIGAVGSVGRLAGVGLAGVAVASAAAGVALFKVGADWDSASDLIATKTGATGDAFVALSDTTKSVFRSIPTDMETAASAVADLSVKTGATGDALDSLAKSEIELARITGTDLNANIDASTKIFNAFGVETENQTKTLDQFFRASQESGMGVDVLMASVQQFAPVLQAMGLGAGESANLIGKLDRAGLHTNVVMQGLKKSLGVFAKAGVSDVKAGMTDVFNSIKNAGSSADATAIAMKYFGAKAGPELAQAILDGKISVDDLTGTLDENGASILETAASTNDFAENLQIFKNNLQLVLIPLGTLVFQWVNLLIPLLTIGAQWIQKFASALGEAFASGTSVSDLVAKFPEPLQGAARGFLLIADAIGDLVHSFQSGGFEAFSEALPQKLDQIKQGLGALASEGFSVLSNAIAAVDWGAVWDVVSDVGVWIAGRLGDATADIAQWAADEIGEIDWSAVWAVVSDVGLWLIDRLGSISLDVILWAKGEIESIDWSQVWAGLVKVGLYLVDKLGDIGTEIGAWAKDEFDSVDWGAAAGDLGEALKPVGTTLLDGFRTGAAESWALFSSWIGNRGLIATNAIGDLLDTLKQKGKDIIDGFRKGAADQWNTFKSWVGNRGLLAASAIGDLGSTLLQKGKDLFDGLRKGASSQWNVLTSWLSNRGSVAVSYVGNLSNTLWNSGWDLISGFANGIWSAADNLVNSALDHVTGLIPSWARGPLGINSPSKLTMPYGMGISEGFALGIVDGAGKYLPSALDSLTSPLASMNARAKAGVAASGIAGTAIYSGGGSSEGNTYNVTVNVNGSGSGDARELGDIVGAQIIRSLKMMGAG